MHKIWLSLLFLGLSACAMSDEQATAAPSQEDRFVEVIVPKSMDVPIPASPQKKKMSRARNQLAFKPKPAPMRDTFGEDQGIPIAAEVDAQPIVTAEPAALPVVTPVHAEKERRRSKQEKKNRVPRLDLAQTTVLEGEANYRLDDKSKSRDLDGLDEAEEKRAERSGEKAQDQKEFDAPKSDNSSPKDSAVKGYILANADVKPARFLPRMFYFENTYLGGNAAFAERLRRLDLALNNTPKPYHVAQLQPQDFDPPTNAGLRLTTHLDRRYIDSPGRVVLQVGLQGSKRFGWRRPPLDIALVVDGSQINTEQVITTVRSLLRGLGPQDRLGLIMSGTPARVIADIRGLREVRPTLIRALEGLTPNPDASPAALTAALRVAGQQLQAVSGAKARIPGTQTVILLTGQASADRIKAAQAQTHALTVQGAVTSVISTVAVSDWWVVANAGYGNYHSIGPKGIEGAVEAELQSLSRVIGRLLRINVRLAPNVEAIRVIGSRVLDQAEVKQVKAREEATDRNLSHTLGVKSDRGADDDGLQTVIPYFFGGDSHVILIELWVNGPGPVAEVSLKYKDMVRLENATARASATLDAIPKRPTPAEEAVIKNILGFTLAEQLSAAASVIRRGQRDQALRILAQARGTVTNKSDLALISGLEQLVQKNYSHSITADAFVMAHDRRISHTFR